MLFTAQETEKLLCKVDQFRFYNDTNFGFFLVLNFLKFCSVEAVSVSENIFRRGKYLNEDKLQ